jgi:hypothetical protein
MQTHHSQGSDVAVPGLADGNSVDHRDQQEGHHQLPPKQLVNLQRAGQGRAGGQGGSAQRVMGAAGQGSSCAAGRRACSGGGAAAAPAAGQRAGTHPDELPAQVGEAARAGVLHVEVSVGNQRHLEQHACREGGREGGKKADEERGRGRGSCRGLPVSKGGAIELRRCRPAGVQWQGRAGHGRAGQAPRVAVVPVR